MTSVTLAHVKREVRSAIDLTSDRAELRQFLERLLSQPGRVLASDGRARWPGFVLQACAAVGGDPRVAARAAAAVELAVAAIDVVDDLIDGDFQGSWVDRGRAQNASLVLGWLSQRCANALGEQVGLERARRVAEAIAAGSIGSCDGQDLDMLLEPLSDVTEDAALEATVRKSGSLCAMACVVGASLATDDTAVLELVGRFGRHAGTTAQLLNDLEGVSIDMRPEKSDFRQRKKTLPTAYLIQCARGEDIPEIRAWYDGQLPYSAALQQSLATAAHDLGALTYTWVVADIHHRQALDTLTALRELTGRDSVLGLRRILPSVRARKHPPTA
jgi:geranylgeranyl diphosphate synthase, type I